LARGTTRQRELAIRTSMGATRGAIYAVSLSEPMASPIAIGRHAEGDMHGIKCSPNGKYLVSFGSESLYVWNVELAELRWQRSDLGRVDCCVVDSDSRRLVCGLSRGGRLVEIDLETSEILRDIATETWMVAEVVFSPDGRRLAAVQTNGKTQLLAWPEATIIWERDSYAAFRRQFETNVFGVLRTASAALPALRSSRGTLVIVGSVSGHVPTAGASAYAMSKAAVHAFAASLRGEVLADGVGVVLVSPGFVESEIRRVDNQGVHHPDAREPVPSWLVVPATRAARAIVRAVASRRREVVVTGHGKVIVWLSRHLPSVLAFALERGAYRSRGEPSGARSVHGPRPPS
jgi:NAD(P)-dependent dehydrogenase (short-subunit alcohol dehydrogenase family)